METLVLIAIAGLIAAMVMAMFLLVIKSTSHIETNMFWTIGTLFAKDKRRAKAIGLTLHSVAGVIFGFLYVAAWGFIGATDWALFTQLGLVTGAVHGVGVAIALILLLTNVTDGFRVAVTHFVAHVVFGIVLGASVSIMQYQFGTMTTVAEVMHGVGPLMSE